MAAASPFAPMSRRLLTTVCKGPSSLQQPLALGRRALSTSTPQTSNEVRIANLRDLETRRREASALESQRFRRWKTGDVYAPHDLSAVEQKKWKKVQKPTMDAFDTLSLDPITLYKNFSIMSEYMTEMGRIKHSAATGLRLVNQRKIAKAIRRAIGLGLMPSTHRHPEILKKEIALRRQRGLQS